MEEHSRAEQSSSDSDSEPQESTDYHHQNSQSQRSIYSSSEQPDSIDQLIYSNDPLSHLRLTEFNAQSIIRHGFDNPSQYPDYLLSISKTYQAYWDQSPYKHISPSDIVQIPHWTSPPKHRTACAALFLCLRLGFDPPDIVKASPAPKLEAWTDPKQLPKETVLETISKRLQQQFESLAPTHARVKFKTYPDVYAEEFKKTLLGLRKFSRLDRCLIYYNGHGVPKPTPTGEIWVFNKAYTQYIPIRLYDILTWVGTPAVFIWDCNNAGQILNHLIIAAKQKDDHEVAVELTKPDPEPEPETSPTPTGTTEQPVTVPTSRKNLADTFAELKLKFTQYTNETIQLAACQPDEMLPRDPKLPADVFTSCLTSPIEMALRFYVLRNNSQRSQWTSTAEFFQDLSKLDKVPGRMEMRRTPLGELTWIYTSIADAIAWNHLDRQTFHKIFRGDLVLAGTFRGFLLAERVMKAYGCTPMSVPKLPATHHAELWHTWDLEVDMCLSQLTGIWKSEEARSIYEKNKHNQPPNSLPPQIVPYRPSTFFSQQLTAFEVWLKFVVDENQDENGEKDEDLIRRRESLQWSCNDWSGVNINQIEISDFTCPNSITTQSQQTSTTAQKDKRTSIKGAVNGKSSNLTTGKSSSSGPQVSSSSSSTPASQQTSSNKPPEQPQPTERPIRYRLPTHIKRFPLNSRKGDDLYPPSPPQLPIVLQVLLSPLHRLRALILLCRLMDLGPWAVHLSLSIGIFQYVLKLLQAPAADLKPVLIFIWARILTVYPEGRIDLMRSSSRPLNLRSDGSSSAGGGGPIEYFIKVMTPNSIELPIVNVVDHKAMCAFILSITCKNSRINSELMMQYGVLEIIMYRIKELVPWQRQWYLILLAHMWEESDLVKGRAIKLGINTTLSDLLTDKVPEVRSAALYAFGTLIGVSTNTKQVLIEDQFPASSSSSTSTGVPSSNNKLLDPSHLSSQQKLRLNKTSIYQNNKLSSLSSSNPLVTSLGYQEQVSIEVGSAMACCHCSTDGSPLFRRELVVVLSALVDQHLGHFIVAAFEFIKQLEIDKSCQINGLVRNYQEERSLPKPSSSSSSSSSSTSSSTTNKDLKENLMTDRTTKLEKLINKLKSDESVHPKESLRAYLWMEYTSIYIVLLDLSLDPSDQVSKPAKTVVDYIHSRLFDSVLGQLLKLNDLSVKRDQNQTQQKRIKDEEVLNRPLGKQRNHSHSNLVGAGSFKPDHKRQLTNQSGVIHRSSTSSVFHSLSTVNNLVPNFVKSSGWKTPFNSTLSRSPEHQQSNINITNHPSSSTIQSPKKITGLRKSTSLNPILHLDGLDNPDHQQSKQNGFESSTASSQSQSSLSTENDHLKNLSINHSIESIIAHTRAADHSRRQANRSYPLAPPPSPSTSSSSNTNESTHTTTTTADSKGHQLEEDEEEDFIYYLGLHNIEKLKIELKSSSTTTDHHHHQQQDKEAEEKNASDTKEMMTRKTILPLISDYYELSSHIFLKPKMASNNGSGPGEGNGDGNGDESSSGSSSVSDGSSDSPHSDHRHHLHGLPYQSGGGVGSPIVDINSRYLNPNNHSNFNNHNSLELDSRHHHHHHRSNRHPHRSSLHHHHSSNSHRHPSNHHHHVNEKIDPGSLESIKDSWRKHRNLKVILENSVTLKSNNIYNNNNNHSNNLKNDDWDHLVCSFDNHNKNPIDNLLFHQFENQLISSDLSGHITVYDWRSKRILNRFLPSPTEFQLPSSNRITSMQLINQDSVALLLTSTPDGNVRIFRDYERAEKMEVVTAFKGLPNNEPSSIGEPGSVTDWQQSTGLLLIGGNSRDIKVWNSRRERSIEDIKSRSNSCLTSISSDHHAGWMISAGFGDGSIRIYDRRKPSKNSLVKVYRSVHNSWCSKIKFQPGYRRDLFSADSTGLVAQWDIRLDSPINTFVAHQLGMPAFDLHDHSPILASGSMNGSVKIWDINDDNNNEEIPTTTAVVGMDRAPQVIFNLRNLYDTHTPIVNDYQQYPQTKNRHDFPLFGSNATPDYYANRNKSISPPASSNNLSLPNTIQPITALSFHSYRMMVSVADGNGKLNVYSTDQNL
ncbi:hypothetical protein MJO29_004039 [Puccinia striiformis f. sp. tritici]|uniref:Raptor N-terminal CASPase-like domain-containing protein n=1 Tax=Puccinia striiformis f. sp. tritici PST-78 TaxID=1165861 RepID=A0A0L0UV97_9BASI|nr:hypothetical protein MJO29_004039 [Puccinia striiformis f. sp. tritici]KNE90871.1 hypothetical protein, variant [Puccinia striiformis f. sp. tritici PST-78]